MNGRNGTGSLDTRILALTGITARAALLLLAIEWEDEIRTVLDRLGSKEPADLRDGTAAR